ncbi:hypothetical protein BDZ91DRAFT_189708 [Kalaharituber pfeilii]|nr:hypothetical protein BDZ91DRAFT_189708 [Kalaharituber pfeilii]
MEPSKSTTNAQQKKDLKRSSKQAQEKKKLEREEERKKKAEEKERRAKERLELAEKRKKERDEKQQKLKDEKEKKLQDGKQKSSITTSASQKASAVDSVPNSSALTVPLHANAPTATPPTAANQKRARSGSGTPPKEEKNREKKQKTSNGLDNDYSETVISGLPRPSAANKSSVLRKTAQNLSAGGNVVDTPDKTRRSVSFANSSQVDPEAPKVPLRPGTPGVKKTPILPPGYVTDGASIVPASKVSAKGKGKTDSQAEKVKTPIPLPNVTPISAPISKAGSGNMQATKTPNKRKNTKLSEEVVGSGESTHEPESDTNNDRGKSTVPNIGSNASSVNLEKAKSIQPTKDASESESGSNSDIDSDSEPVPAKKEASLPTADTKAISVPGRITRQTISPSTAPKKNEELTPASGNEHESTGGTEVNEPMQNKPQEKPTTTKADTKSATPKSSASVFSESEDEDESAESVDTSDTSDISESSDASDSEEDSSSDASSPSASPKATKVADKITKAIAATTKISSPAANFPPDIPPSSQKYKALSQMAFSDPPEVLEKYAAAASKENQQSTQASKLTEDSDDDDDDDEDSETESETDSNSDIIPTDKKAGAEFTGGKRKSRKQNSLGGFFSRRKSGVSTK